MYNRKRTLGRLGQTAPPVTESMVIPASVGGINAFDSLMNMPPEDCIYSLNLMPVEYGLRLRKGYREWATGCIESPARATGEVRTIIPFESKVQNAENDRLFAVTDEGIWDVTLFSDTNPPQEVVFANTGPQSGRGVFCEFTGDAAGESNIRGHYLFYADGENGLWEYTEESGAWTRPPSGTAAGDWWFVDVETPGSPTTPFPVDLVVFVMVHKQRIWVILKDDDDAWYLPIGSISGELKRFTFGSKLPHGGNLQGLWDWTVDGGDGVDDYLVAVGRGGDVVLYRGDDPEIIATTTTGAAGDPWSLVGSWVVGEVPNSRRIALDFGTELFILSTMGLIALSDLLKGSPVVAANTESPSRKINRFLRRDVDTGKDDPQWQVVINPSDGFLQIITPTPANSPFLQYSLNLNTGGWGNWEGVPMTCANFWHSQYYMGASEDYKPGVVLIYDGEQDGTTIRGVEMFQIGAISGDPEWGLVTNDYVCSGAIGVAIGTVTIPEVSSSGTRYVVSYTCTTTTPDSAHAVSFGKADPTSVDLAFGDGTFSRTILADVASSTVSFVGGPNFNGTISNVSVRVAPDTGEPIPFRTLTSFQPGGEHARFKQVGHVRVQGVTSGAATFNLDAVYDYEIEKVLPAPPALPGGGSGLWDSAIWDESVWTLNVSGQSYPLGTLGIGRAIAVGMRGFAENRINIVGWDVLLRTGGYL